MDNLQQENEIVAELKGIHAEIAGQRSFRHAFVIGVISGIGFFVGSVIIATIALGLFGPFFSNVQWIHQSYEAGAAFKR